jgi:hypothetical protein
VRRREIGMEGIRENEIKKGDEIKKKTEEEDEIEKGGG